MHATTGFTREEITALCELIHTRAPEPGHHRGRPPALGLFNRVRLTLSYLRRNRVQAELAADYGISQPTVSRIIARYTILIGEVLSGAVPTADDLDPDTQFIIDGTLVLCWSWHDHPELYSGKHHRTGMKLQVACTLDCHLAWVSDPVLGRTHDTAAIRASGILDGLEDWALGDKGYAGLTMITPLKKGPGEFLTDRRKQFNHDIGTLCYQIERTIANLKMWRILHADYRRPLDTFTETITTVIALQFHRLGY